MTIVVSFFRLDTYHLHADQANATATQAATASTGDGRTGDAAASSDLGLSSRKLDAITLALQAEVDQGQIAGAVAAVSRGGKVVYFQAVGDQDIDSGKPMRRDSLFRIASMTKAITSAAVLKLIEQGTLSLDDPLSKYLPEFGQPQVLTSVEGESLATTAAERVPTIHDLLTHRSGLTYGWFGPEKLDQVYRRHQLTDWLTPAAESMERRVRRVAEVPLKFQPGSAWDYGVSTDVLGRVIEVASGQSLEEFFREHFFEPLQMNDTHFVVPAEKRDRLATLYLATPDGRLAAAPGPPASVGFLRLSNDFGLADSDLQSGGGGLVSSTSVFLSFLHALLRGGELDGKRVLAEASVAAMSTNQIGELTIPFPGHGDRFGFGFGVLTERGVATDRASVGTYSWGGIFNTYFWVDPAEDLVGVLMTQVFPNNELKTRQTFKELTYDALPRQVRLDEHARDASAGNLQCYRIETPNAVFYLDKVGAGVSSMIDRDGNDWLSFDPRAGTGAAGEYRGFPNAVFREAGSYFHPRNEGTDPCVTTVRQVLPDRVVIDAEADNGLWAGRFTFTADGCTFTLTKKPNDRPYWVLYEGTPGGQYDDTDWWIDSSGGERTPLTTPHEGDLPAPEWIGFGDQNATRMLFLQHHEDDASPDRFYQMEKQMTVFGFGREGMKKHLKTVPQSFTIGFVETDKFDEASHEIAEVTKRLAAAGIGEPSEQQMGKRRLLEQYSLTHKGNVEAGKKLFFEDERAKCVTCHRADNKGGDVGPDLTKIGGKFDRPHLIESLLEPSRQIVEGYRTTLLLGDDGTAVTGIVKSETDDALELIDASGRKQSVAKGEIAARKEADVSLMPSGLVDALSPAEFTDLVAYLETLRTGKMTFGAGVSGPIDLPEGFQIETVATGLSGATAMEVASDGRVFVCEQPGTLRVIKEGKLLVEPVLTLDVENNWERGLIGVALARDFPHDPHLFVVHVAGRPYPHHRVSRFRIEGDRAVKGSEQLLLAGDDQRTFGGNVPAGHQGGAIHVGNDGKLYIGIGEQTAKTPAQRMDALQGKILRINQDGSIPDDNPFLTQTDGKYQSIWAIGCRNPFTFAVRRSTGEILINDVGGKFEEINRGIAGANYGWPLVDHGPTDKKGITSPIHRYPEASISGGAFTDDLSDWPEGLQGRYFFADFVHGWIKSIDPENPEAAETFANGLRRPVDLKVAPDQSMYVLLRNAWVVDDKFSGGTGALMRIIPPAADGDVR